MAPISTNQRYLERYGETCAAQLLNHLVPTQGAKEPLRWHNVLIIPLFDEAQFSLQHLLGRLSLQQPTLLILVFNAPQGGCVAAAERTRSAYLQHRRALHDVRLDTATISMGKLPRVRPPHPQQASANAFAILDVMLIDACSEPSRYLPASQGVGLARKMGNDTALALFELGLLATPWLHQTDADVALPSDYFSVAAPPGVATVTYPFVHIAAPDDPDADQLNTRIALYETHMQRYVDRLAQARSPYAYPALGSTLAIHADHYGIVRGFPKRNAGEDFHMLNKLRKTGAIQQLDGTALEIAARWSDRVPFGTGPALKAIDPGNFVTYADNSFDLLRHVLSQFEQLAAGPNTPPQWRPEAQSLLAELKILPFLDKLNPKSAASVRRKAIHDRFDALKTLRFIHLSRRWWPDEANFLQHP